MPASEIRPWGKWEEYLYEPGYRVRRLLIHPGKMLSLQRHMLREEVFVVVSGEATITVGDLLVQCQKGALAQVPKGVAYRIQNEINEYLVLIEIQVGSNVSDNDIARFDEEVEHHEDVYGKS